MVRLAFSNLKNTFCLIGASWSSYIKDVNTVTDLQPIDFK